MSLKLVSGEYVIAEVTALPVGTLLLVDAMCYRPVQHRSQDVICGLAALTGPFVEDKPPPIEVSRRHVLFIQPAPEFVELQWSRVFGRVIPERVPLDNLKILDS
jgi:hypothetical protein